MARFFDALGRFSVRFRYPIVLLWLAAAVAATQLLPSLGSTVDNDNTAFLPADSPSVRAADQFRAVGVGLGVGVLMDTFLVRTLLIPSTAMPLGRANWWPARLGGPERPQPLPPEPERAVRPS